MKKIIFIAITLFFTGLFAKAQHNNSNPSSKSLSEEVQKVVRSDQGLKDISNTIIQVELKKKLNLNELQQKAVSGALVSFFKARFQLKEHMNSQPQLEGLFNTLKLNLSSVLTDQQMNTFISLRPPKEESGLLSVLFPF